MTGTQRHIGRMLLVCAMLASAVVTAMAVTDSSPAEAASYGTLRAQHSGRCLEVADASTDDGAAIQQWSCQDTDNQLWARVPAGDGVMLQALHSDKCLTIENASTSNGAPAIQMPCAQLDNQIFTVQNDNHYTAKHSGRCLDIAYLSRSNGAGLRQSSCGILSNQRFDFSVVRDVADPTPTTTTTVAPDPDPDPPTLDLIPDEGLPAETIAASALVSERTERLEAGVVGYSYTGDSFTQTNIRVAAITQFGDTMYVGGKFTQVEIAATGERIDQPFLAAFNQATGAWIDSFRPTLDGTVWDLKATPDGRLVVAGQFTNVNGVSGTTALAVLDPITGAVDPTFRADLRLTGSSNRALARTVDIEGDFLYIGGNFTRITGTTGGTRSVGQIARIRLSNGVVDGAFLPNFDGVIFDIDATPDRVYVAGNFLYVNDVFSVGLAVLQPGDGQFVPGLKPFVRTDLRTVYRSYQQAVLPVDDEVWLAGSEHLRQVYSPGDFSLIRGWVSMPYGDGQALAELNGFVYTGSHANGNTYLYRDTTDYPNVSGNTGRMPIRWMGAFDNNAYEQVDWYPQIGSEKGEGSWELFADSTDCLWTGGDFNRGSYDGNVPRYVGGFAKFCAQDSVAPEPPTSPTAEYGNNGVNLAWTGSTDNRGGQVRYEILKNDRILASYIGIETFRDADGLPTDRYFVRAMDVTGNRSATTPVFTPTGSDTSAPSTPQDLVATLDDATGDVTLTWTEATDNIAVAEYVVFDAGIEIARTTDTTATITSPDAGIHYYQVLAIDTAGNEGNRTPSTIITIQGDDVTPPGTPTDLAADVTDGDVTLTWTAPTDDVGVVDYLVFDTDVQIGVVTDTTLTIPDETIGDHYYQVLARDAAGNEGNRTASLDLTIEGADTTPPRTPINLVGEIIGDDVQLDWEPRDPDDDIAGYIVYRNAVEIQRTTEPTALIVAPGAGSHWYQVRAFDAAGNESYKTPSTRIDIVDVATDTEAPRTPRDLVGVVQPNGDVALTWTASVDNVGVAGYIVFRNGVEIQRVTDPNALIPAPGDGNHWYQVRAFDAAGNESYKTPSTLITIVGVDTDAPNTPRDLVATLEANGDITLTWTGSVDNVGVAGYIVFDTGAEIQRVTETTTTVTAPAAGPHWFQVRAFDAAGNESYKTPSTRIDI